MRSTGTLHLEDVVKTTVEFAHAVQKLQTTVFEHLYSLLEQIESVHFCGFYKSRGCGRYVSAEPNLKWDSGRCQSREWFDSEPEYRCSAAATCKAYARAQEANTSSLPNSEILDVPSSEAVLEEQSTSLDDANLTDYGDATSK